MERALLGRVTGRTEMRDSLTSRCVVVVGMERMRPFIIDAMMVTSCGEWRVCIVT